MGEHPGLARSGAGNDQQRAVVVRDGVVLRGVEPGEQFLVGNREIGHGEAILRVATHS